MSASAFVSSVRRLDALKAAFPQALDQRFARFCIGDDAAAPPAATITSRRTLRAAASSPMQNRANR